MIEKLRMEWLQKYDQYITAIAQAMMATVKIETIAG